MPCRDGGEYTSHALITEKGLNDLKKRLDSATRAACEALDSLQNISEDSGYPISDYVSKDTVNWWSNHQAAQRLLLAYQQRSLWQS